MDQGPKVQEDNVEKLAHKEVKDYLDLMEVQVPKDQEVYLVSQDLVVQEDKLVSLDHPDLQDPVETEEVPDYKVLPVSVAFTKKIRNVAEVGKELVNKHPAK